MYFLMIATVSLLISLMGCQKQDKIPETDPTILAILVGNHANSKQFEFQIDTKVKQVYTSLGNICIINIDGNPDVIRKESNEMAGCFNAEFLLESQNDKQYEKIWIREYLEPQVSEFNKYFERSCANDPEVDTLKALQIAADTLYSIETTMARKVNKEIFIYDTGLCTTGKLNFLDDNRENLIGNDKKLWEDDASLQEVTDLINDLDNHAEIPNLSDIAVTWFGLGEVSEPQPEFDNLKKQNLQYIWGELLKKAKASSSTSLDVDSKYNIFAPVNTYGTQTSECYVTPIFFWDKIGKNESDEKIPKITEEKVGGFVANREEYCSVEKAESEIFPYAQNILHYPNQEILLVGTTSSWHGGSASLSVERAEKVKSTLVKFGVSEDKISVIGLGYNLELCQDDSPNGFFDESIGKENRAVFILPLNSERAQKIKSMISYEVD